jgi:hypothetical protein
MPAGPVLRKVSHWGHARTSVSKAEVNAENAYRGADVLVTRRTGQHQVAQVGIAVGHRNIIHQSTSANRAGLRGRATSSAPAGDAALVVAGTVEVERVALQVELALSGLRVSSRATTTTSVLTSLRPRLGVDGHRIQTPQHSSRELAGRAVHLHARFTPPMALGIPTRPQGQARMAPPDARRVRNAQPHRRGRLERPVKLHESSRGHMRDAEIEHSPRQQDSAAEPAEKQTNFECNPPTRAGWHSGVPAARKMSRHAAGRTRPSAMDAPWAGMAEAVTARPPNAMCMMHARMRSKVARVHDHANDVNATVPHGELYDSVSNGRAGHVNDVGSMGREVRGDAVPVGGDDAEVGGSVPRAAAPRGSCRVPILVRGLADARQVL